jgi:hypothetical protein
MTPHRAIVVITALAVVTTASRAQEHGGPELTGSLRGGYWSSTRTLDRRDPYGAGMMWLKTTAQMSSQITLFAEGWGALRGPAEDTDATAELREAYVTAAMGNLDVRVGRQIIAWGRADGVNPTGNLAAEDLTLLTPDDADRRLGVSAATVSYYLGGLSISGFWIPEFRGHRIALPANDAATFIEVKERWPGDQWALRVEHTGGAVDWSMSMFRGYDLSPDLEPAGSPGVVALRYRRIQAFGTDAAATIGRYGLRAEGAYVRTDDGSGTDPFTKNPFVYVVIGGDRTFDGRLNLNLQYLARAVVRFRAPPPSSPPDVAAIATQQAILSSQTRRVQHGASMRASYTWLHETLETEWAALAYADPRGVAMRPKVTYAVTDRLSVVTGAELFRGEDESLLGLLRPNSAAYLELRWGF